MVLNGYHGCQDSQYVQQDGHKDGQVGNKGSQDIQQNVIWLHGIAITFYIINYPQSSPLQ